jgi:hypothetical protein
VIVCADLLSVGSLLGAAHGAAPEALISAFLGERAETEVRPLDLLRLGSELAGEVDSDSTFASLALSGLSRALGCEDVPGRLLAEKHWLLFDRVDDLAAEFGRKGLGFGMAYPDVARVVHDRSFRDPPIDVAEASGAESYLFLRYCEECAPHLHEAVAETLI